MAVEKDQLEKDLEEIWEVIQKEKEEEVPLTPEEERRIRLEHESVPLRMVIRRLLPRKVQSWISQVEKSKSYWDVPIPQFIPEVWNENWDNGYIAFAPSRVWEGDIRKGITLRIVLEHKEVNVWINGLHLFGVDL